MKQLLGPKQVAILPRDPTRFRSGEGGLLHWEDVLDCSTYQLMSMLRSQMRSEEGPREIDDEKDGREVRRDDCPCPSPIVPKISV